MAFDTHHNVVIRGISCAVPETTVKAEAYTEALGEKAVKRFVTSTGIKQRHIGDGSVIASDFCFSAALDLFEKLNVDRSEIDALIFVTESPDYPSPATACVLQDRLGLSEHCLAFDMTMGCSGYIYGLHTAGALLKKGHIENVLLLAGQSQYSTLEDKSQMMLFGEAGSATLLSCKETEESMRFQLKTLGSGFRHIMRPCGGFRHPEGERRRMDRGNGIVRSDFEPHLNASEVANFTITEVPKMFHEFHEHFGTSPEAYDYYILHQANKFLLDYIAKKSGLPKDRIPLSLDRYGNTSSASLPITICDFFNNEYIGPQRVELFLSGFGVGLSLGVATLSLNTKTCFPIICINEGWDDMLGDIIWR